MARSYCVNADVKSYLPNNLVTEGSNPTPNPLNPAPETVRTVDIDFWVQQACSDIDSALGTMYDVPLKQVNQGGDVSYPAPIPRVAALLAAEMIYERVLQGADRQRSEAQKEREKWAHDELAAIQNGERKLYGQRTTRGSRFIRNTLFDAPRNPAEGRRTRGNGS